MTIAGLIVRTTNPLSIFIHGAGDDPLEWSQAIADRIAGYALE